ncbi:unnamed protein product [Lactuca saligna]|uniref:F-box domain-containing protein n=1 Tax=Lactuca saligna TaxID=75948 RepID=A0AA35YPD7_LACSI|nr:unnamed protein product [Lactuca saligna]
MKNIVKYRKEDADASSPFSRLPDEIILQIINKLIDFKTLGFCYLVSKRFSSIVLQVDAISFTVPFIDPNIPDKNTVDDVVPSRPFPPMVSSFFGESFLSTYTFLSKFKGVKSLSIELASFGHRAIDNRCLFKWKVKFGNRIESFMFLSPHSVYDKDGSSLSGNGDEEEEENLVIHGMFRRNFEISLQCLEDVIAWHIMLMDIVKDLPMLEEVSITDSGRRGRLSLSGEKLIEVKEWVNSASKAEFSRVEVPTVMSNGYIPLLKLPVSGYVMKEIYFGVMKMKDLEGGNDGVMSIENGSEDKEEAAYTEAYESGTYAKFN